MPRRSFSSHFSEVSLVNMQLALAKLGDIQNKYVEYIRGMLILKNIKTERRSAVVPIESQKEY